MSIKKTNAMGEVYSPKLIEDGILGQGLLLLPEGDPQRVFAKIVDSLVVFQGDIILGTEESCRALLESQPYSLGTTLNRLLWPQGKVYYTINNNIKGKSKVIEAAMQHWSDNTLLRFEERTNQRNYIEFVGHNGYASSIGMQGGKQLLAVNFYPDKGKVMHEIGHAVGLYHEHSRPDRDEYISIFSDRILPKALDEFSVVREPSTTNESNYDYGSLMHYSLTAFSQDGFSPTIKVLKETNEEVGQRNGLSKVDITNINKMYQNV